MGKVKISALTEASSGSGTDVIPAVVSGVTVKAARARVVTVDTIAALRTTSLNRLRGCSIHVAGYYDFGDVKMDPYHLVEGAAPGTYVDNGGSIIVPTGGDGSSAFISIPIGDVDVKSFGAKGDGITDDHSCIQKAMTFAVANKKRIVIPGGTFPSSSALVTSGYPVSLSGSGVSVTKIIFTSTTGGMRFNVDPQGAGIPPDQATISGLTIESHAVVSTPALYISWTTYQPNAQGQLWIQDLNICRNGETGTGSFTSMIKLENCIVGFVSRVTIVGDDSRTADYAIWLLDCVGIRITDCDINRTKYGIHITKSSAVQTEGILISNSFIYDVNRGVNAVTAIHVNIIGTHINTNGASCDFCVVYDTVSQSIISGCLLYSGGNPGDATGQTTIYLVSGSNNIVTNNLFVALIKANTSFGILLGYCSYCDINGNNINNYPIGVNLSIDASTIYNMVSSNQFTSCTQNINDADTTLSNYKNANFSTTGPVSGVSWGINTGTFGVGEIGSDANWGGYMRGRSGTLADLAFADSLANVAAAVKDKSFRVATFAKASLPIVTSAGGGCICVSDDVGGFTLAFCDGTNWRRVSDRAIIS